MELELGRRKEWLETNGLGGYASSTVAGLNTRRYHGLLVAATNPPGGRMVLLSRLEDTLRVNGHSYDLSVNEYPGVVHPQGHLLLKEFRLEPHPVFVYQAGPVELEKRIFMVHGENTVVIEYQLRNPEAVPECYIDVRPLIAFRDYHATMRWNDSVNHTLSRGIGLVSLNPYPGCPTLHLAHTNAQVHETGDWYYNFELSAERERGLEFHEDLYCPLVISMPFSGEGQAALIASTEIRNAMQSAELRRGETERRAGIMNQTGSNDPLIRQLALSADQFIVQRGDLHTIIAGYPWFSDWGRDTMIALPGLTLATRRPEIARDILQAFAARADQGMLPNRFADDGEAAEYNSVDATLWFFEAAQAYWQATGDEWFVRDKLYGVLKDMVEWHFRGTRHGIHVDAGGLLACGQSGLQLTWMDAKVGNWVVTPRSGKPVEVQALWFNALCILRDFAVRFGDTSEADSLKISAQRAAASFREQFWNPARQCLYDVIDGDKHDASIRPNQIFAVSLTHSMLSPSQARLVVDTVERELLTPKGLRTLSPADPQYCPHYEGGVAERDAAYHQGTVWPWLIGPFITAYVAVHQGNPETRSRVAAWVKGLSDDLKASGLGQISEVCDGDFPHKAGGCFAQAWSVAELLRVVAKGV